MENHTSPPIADSWNSRNLLTMPEVAKWARVHPKTVNRWIKEGKLEAIQFGPPCFEVKIKYDKIAEVTLLL
jgi:excisionase family DNA binding protein